MNERGSLGPANFCYGVVCSSQSWLCPCLVRQGFVGPSGVLFFLILLFISCVLFESSNVFCIHLFIVFVSALFSVPTVILPAEEECLRTYQKCFSTADKETIQQWRESQRYDSHKALTCYWISLAFSSFLFFFCEVPKLSYKKKL